MITLFSGNTMPFIPNREYLLGFNLWGFGFFRGTFRGRGTTSGPGGQIKRITEGTNR